MQRRQFMKMLAAGGTVSALGACVPLGTPLGTLGAREVAQADFDVIVVGAGISGLNAAMALEMQNRKVLVLEASQRVGGRMYTMEAGGLQFDVGATDVGGNYWMTRAMSQRLGVTVRDPAPGDTSRARAAMETALVMGDQIMPIGDWPQSPLNPLAGRERAMPPPALFPAAMANNPLMAPLHWLDPSMAAEDIPLRAWLARKWSREAIGLMEVGATYSDFDRVSALDVLRRGAIMMGGPRVTGTIEGGTQRLPEAMAARLQRPVEKGVHVSEIIEADGLVHVTASDGRRWRAAHVIVAIPPGPLGKINLGRNLPPEQRKAWSERHLTAVTTVHVKPLRPYWEQDGLPLNMWLDGSIERMFGIPGPDGKIQRAIIWINGAGAEALDRMDDAEIGRWAQAELGRVRPAAAGATQVLAVRNWGRDPYSMGAFAEIAPGRCASTAEWTAKPLGRIHFAGEHTSFDQPGLEAAMASGIRAAVEVSNAYAEAG
ncbi:MAG: FAD-dependent oxidoreductase [Pseudoxanthomonas sp.]|nr:FAD-dependent oxidoreductase [Pseudoxanthomonas sp.]MBP7366565.1 FAD-dependent oxidoreductase [Pseudoxanthomonas sp.]TXI33288.1 MAG: FAD-dependent oxidoreductase [Ottowia sp.]